MQGGAGCSRPRRSCPPCAIVCTCPEGGATPQSTLTTSSTRRSLSARRRRTPRPGLECWHLGGTGARLPHKRCVNGQKQPTSARCSPSSPRRAAPAPAPRRRHVAACAHPRQRTTAVDHVVVRAVHGGAPPRRSTRGLIHRHQPCAPCTCVFPHCLRPSAHTPNAHALHAHPCMRAPHTHPAQP